MNKQEGEEEEDIPIFRSSRSVVQPSRYSRASLKTALHEPPDGYEVKEPLPSPSPLIKSEPLEKENSVVSELKESLPSPVAIIKSEPLEKKGSVAPASSIKPAKLSEKKGSKARSIKLNEQSTQSQTDEVPQPAKSQTNIVNFRFDKNLKRFSFKKLLPSYWLGSTYNKRDSSSAKPQPIPVKKELKSPPEEEIPLKKYSFRRFIRRGSARPS
ncbi:uncharacterized protein ACN2A1_000883 [Glossina fuscipes fuscipes]